LGEAGRGVEVKRADVVFLDVELDPVDADVGAVRQTAG
jgi:hypothetical protein